MEKFSEIIDKEEKRLMHVAIGMRETLDAESCDRQDKDGAIAELKRQELETNDWKEKRELSARIATTRRHYDMRLYQDRNVLNKPYFGVLEIEDDDLGPLNYCLGAQSFFDRNNRILVIDWREAPISRLYYEYEAGEDYDEDIRGRERSGVIRAKRKVDTNHCRLQKIVDNDILLIRDQNGEWRKAGDSDKPVSRKEESADHRLPEITALIDKQQFQTITRPESGTILHPRRAWERGIPSIPFGSILYLQ